MHDAVQLRLRVRGVEYADILSATWSRGLEQVADTVQITWSEKWIPLGQALPFRKLDPCEFVIDDRVVMTGYIANQGPRGYSGDGPRQLQTTCMSKAWLAVRGSHLGKQRTWRDVTLMRIATDLLKSFGITVSTTLTDIDEPFQRHGAGVGETAWSILHRALRARGLWASSKPDGNVEIVEASRVTYATPLVGPGAGLPVNLLSSTLEDSAEDLHSEIVVVGQAGKRADWSGAQAAHGWAKAADPSVEVYCPLVLFETSISKQRELAYRADWEVKTRAARARAMHCEVQGVYWDEQPLSANRRIQIIDPLNDVEGEMLIVNVATNFGDGTTSQVDIMPPEAFLRESPLPKRKVLPRNADGRFVQW